MKKLLIVCFCVVNLIFALTACVSAATDIEHFKQGLVHYNNGDLQSAAKEWETALTLNPQNSDANFGLRRIKAQTQAASEANDATAFAPVLPAVETPQKVNNEISKDEQSSQSQQSGGQKGQSIFMTAANAPLTEGANVVYAAAFQMAWDTLIDKIIKDKIQLEGNPPLAKALNLGRIGKKDLSSEAYFADAGSKKDGIEQRVRNGLKQKFNTEPINDISLKNPDDILAYAYLYKNLTFNPKFEKNNYFYFMGEDVEAFGINSFNPYDKAQAQMAQNVKINYYRPRSYDEKTNTSTRKSFVVTINSKDNNDEIIFALIEKEKDLELAIKKALSLRKENISMEKDDVLLIPAIKFDETKEFQELYKNIINYAPYAIAKALQTVKFDMNYEGVKLIVEAVIAGFTSPAPQPQPKKLPKIMRFDSPFLVLMKEK
ncbi:MAG: tetratricopeptide repeat protein, partial [Elusimicrobiota bacterium]|nr:tetratricopeptide repeat protein [Elusimicrobiota bacterium]